MMGEEKPAANSASSGAAKKAAGPGDGIRDIRTTNIFRAVNFELYAKPNRVVMIVGVLAFSACTAYIAWWNTTVKNEQGTYMALQDDGTLAKRKRRSGWD